MLYCECGHPNYRIEVSHIDGKEWIKCNYYNFMMVPLEESKYNEPEKRNQKENGGVPVSRRPQVYQSDDDVDQCQNAT